MGNGQWGRIFGLVPKLRRAALILWIAFLVLTLVVKAGWTTAADTRLILATRSMLPDLTTFLQACSWTVGHGAALFAIPLAVLIGFRAGRRAGWRYTIACLGGWLVNLLLKQMIQQTRPNGISPKLTDAGWLSFPSGHAMLSAVIFGYGALLLASTLAGAARWIVLVTGFLLTLLIGLSRVYLGAHWPSDVLGAWIAGAGWVVVCVMLDLTRRPPVAA